MVNKIDGNNYYTYPKPQRVNIPDTGEKFSLGNEKEGLQTGLKDREQVSDQEKQQAPERDGVRIELSSRGVEKQKQEEAAGKQSNESGLNFLLDSIRTFFTAAIAAVKDIFGKIWNDPQQEAAADSPEQPDVIDITGEERAEAIDVIGDPDGTEAVGAAGSEGVIRVEAVREAAGLTDVEKEAAAARVDAESSDREIRRHLKNGDVEQVIRLLTDNGRKTAARNTTLLTFYDKNGRVVKPDASVQQRTLYGDKNTRKL